MSPNEFLVLPQYDGTRKNMAFVSVLAVIVIGTTVLVPRVTAMLDQQNAARVAKAQLAKATQKKQEAERNKKIEEAKLADLLQHPAGGGHSKADEDYWRKVMQVWSLVRNVPLTITSFAVSPYEKASKLTVNVGKTPSSERLAETLYFLQSVGWLESYEKGTAIVHVQ